MNINSIERIRTMPTATASAKETFKVGDTVYWPSACALILCGEIVKMQHPIVTIRISGGTRRQVRIDIISKNKPILKISKTKRS